MARATGGFTLIELLLSSAVMTVLMATALPLAAAWQPQVDLDTAATKTVQSLRVAKSRAEGARGDATWGVHLAGSTLTIFQGGHLRRISRFVVNAVYFY